MQSDLLVGGRSAGTSGFPGTALRDGFVAVRPSGPTSRKASG
ncbi:hypothetical protein [Streptomyces sp. NPDC059247]